jgi:hypothetical protein
LNHTNKDVYEAFLRSKMITTPERGIAIDASAINPLLKPHQAATVRWAVQRGNAAIFQAFGLGKTFEQLEIARLIRQHAGGKFLIVAPLGVRQEFKRDAQKLHIDIEFVRRFEECRGDGIFLTNYETIRVYDFEQHVGLGEELEVCAHCSHIHLGVKDDDLGKVCGVEFSEAEHLQMPRLATCHCTRYESALPNKFMLLQPQSWHPDVWTDITRMLSLNSAQSAAGREMHLCPMQFDLADRAIAQFSQPGEVVLDPFSGLGTVPLRAIKQRRRGLGIELSPAYFKDACFYCEAAERQMATPSLFDMLAEPEREAEAIAEAV